MSDELIIEVFINKCVNLLYENASAKAINPYVVIKSGFCNQMKTQTISNSLNPIFEQKFTLKTKDFSNIIKSNLILEVYSHKTFGSDVFIGNCSISSNFLLYQSKNSTIKYELPIHHPFNGIQGTLYFDHIYSSS